MQALEFVQDSSDALLRLALFCPIDADFDNGAKDEGLLLVERLLATAS